MAREGVPELVHRAAYREEERKRAPRDLGIVGDRALSRGFDRRVENCDKCIFRLREPRLELAEGVVDSPDDAGGGHGMRCEGEEDGDEGCEAHDEYEYVWRGG